MPAARTPTDDHETRRAGRARGTLLRGLGALAAVCMALPVLALATTGTAGASYPDNVAQPVPFGDAGFFGPSGGLQLNAPDVGMVSTADGQGYWIVASDGGIFNYGDAAFFGSAGAIALNKPIVGMAATPDGGGYWLVAADGGIFSFGDATFFGSTGNIRLNQPIVGMAVSPGGTGYWLAASDGGIFNYGTAPFLGSMGGTPLVAPIVGIAAPSGGAGYWLAAKDGGVFNFGSAGFGGSMGGQQNSNPIRGIAATPDGAGYWLLPTSPPPAPPSIGPGSSGAWVTALQNGLTSLGYWVDTNGGSFDDSTEQAVWALQKAAGLPTDGVVGPSTWAALYEGVVPHPRSTSGYVVEIDLEDDLLMVVNNGHLEYTLNTSTGGGYLYTEDGVTNVAITPRGMFTIYNATNGLVVDSLGALWRPRYFTAGYAIHGDSSVPPVPVSHGCARISNEAIDWVWANNIMPIGTAVWVY